MSNAAVILPSNTVFIDGRPIEIENERNLLELIRKAGIDLPTFCYHSDLSVYGACRLCLVEVEGRGIQGACSLPPEPGMRIKTSTPEIRNIRRVAVELLLANHDQRCPTCPKSGDCQLQALARKLGIKEVRFKQVWKPTPVDASSPSVVRDPNRCVLCGDCIRMCGEVQGVGAIDFAHRGAEVAVVPSFGKGLGDVECVNCGQCAAVCPTGALTPRSEVEDVYRSLANPKKRVVAQIAPAVRVALGECFGLEPGVLTAGQAVAALKALGFSEVYDTAFAADLTVIEEGQEFIGRIKAGERLPQFTSCCPAWVKFAEQYYPTLLSNLSSCRSPQQMLGSVVKRGARARFGMDPADVVMVSIMPCTAKKFEAKRPELSTDGVQDVDHVLTTEELARMIENAGLRFEALPAVAFDMPLGVKSGAGVIFGASGGVTEATLRFAAAELVKGEPPPIEVAEVRGEEKFREASLRLGDKTLRVAVVHGLGNARALADRILRGEGRWDLIEVMACPGGCIGGAGQPIQRDAIVSRRKRAAGLYAADRGCELRRSQDNPFIQSLYKGFGDVVIGEPHEALHTKYHNRRRLPVLEMSLEEPRKKADRVEVKVCVGTSCFIKGSQRLLTDLLSDAAEERGQGRVDVSASFCFENCSGKGPTVSVDGQLVPESNLAKVRAAIDKALSERKAEVH